MRYLKPNETPLLPLNGMLAGECVAFGAGEAGIVIQYCERDKCILVGWEEIVRLGIELMKIADKPEDTIEEIDKPTVIE